METHGGLIHQSTRNSPQIYQHGRYKIYMYFYILCFYISKVNPYSDDFAGSYTQVCVYTPIELNYTPIELNNEIVK